jgi:hypothetical protein
VSEGRGGGAGVLRAALLPFALALLPFTLLATGNSAGYRYGASDLAFYGPVVMRELDPQLFPRDAPVIDAQGRLTLMDESVAAIARATTSDLSVLFLSLYVAGLGLIALAGSIIGAQLYRSRWTTVALLAALTLRHAIPRTGANSLEAYFHPRQLAFGFGALAVAAFLAGRTWAVLAALAAAAALHPTAALWFVVWMGAAAVQVDRRMRGLTVASAVVAAAAAVWAFADGPLAGRLVTMDAAWLDAIADKEYLFPLRWPAAAWLVNLAYAPLIWLVYRWRVRRARTHPRERALVVGCLALVAVFALAVPFNARHTALAIQLQPARVFWLLDFLAVIYAAWALAEAGGTAVRPRAAALVLLVLSVVRAVYVMEVEFPGRRLFETTVPGDWGRVSAWAQTTPKDSGWLADPAHASRYGTSLRMAGRRDVFVEAVKDGAIGMYDRSVALRTRQRLQEIGDFAALSAPRARELGAAYDLDYVITEADLPLPLAFQSGAIRVYRLR